MDCVNNKSGKWQNNLADKSCPGQLLKHRFFRETWRNCTNRGQNEFQNSRLQNEAKCKTFAVKMSFIYMRIKNH